MATSHRELPTYRSLTNNLFFIGLTPSGAAAWCDPVTWRFRFIDVHRRLYRETPIPEGDEILEAGPPMRMHWGGRDD